jgi:hypothetical protein
MFNAVIQSGYKTAHKILLCQAWVIHLHERHKLLKSLYVLYYRSSLFDMVKILQGAASTV